MRPRRARRALASPVMGAMLSLAAVARSGAQAIAITGATIYPVSGPKIEHGTLVIRDGKIAAVGLNVPIPAGATTIDASGRWVTPGLIQTGTALGIKLLESGGLRQTEEDSVVGEVN